MEPSHCRLIAARIADEGRHHVRSWSTSLRNGRCALCADRRFAVAWKAARSLAVGRQATLPTVSPLTLGRWLIVVDATKKCNRSRHTIPCELLGLDRWGVSLTAFRQ